MVHKMCLEGDDAGTSTDNLGSQATRDIQMTFQSKFGTFHDELGEKRLARQVLDERTMRIAHFPGGIFGETAWDILLVLFSKENHLNMIAADIAAELNTALTSTVRWIHYLEQQSFIQIRLDPLDARREIVELTPEGMRTVSAYVVGIRENRR
jgi:DNA-binding MarR family transcriptional regulator